MSLGRVWGRVQVGGEVGFLWKMSEKREGAGRVGGGAGTGKGTGKSMCMRLSKLPFSDLPLVPPRSLSYEISHKKSALSFPEMLGLRCVGPKNRHFISATDRHPS